MSQPFYVSPQQLMADRADFARKGIARGRSVLVAQYDQGIAFLTENPSKALHKFSEIYDRIGFAAVGKYNEFENLRVAGIRYADMRGFTYDRKDVNARGLANAYAQTLGTAFTNESKPLEVELVVAEVGNSTNEDLLYRLTFDGSVAEERNFVVMGGQAGQLHEIMTQLWRPNCTLNEVIAIMREALERGASGKQADAVGEGTSQLAGSSQNIPASTEQSSITAENLEAAVLDRSRARRKFRRLTAQNINEILGENS